MVFDNSYRSCIEVLLDCGEVGEEDRRLFVWPPARAPTKEHHGRNAGISRSEETAEICVGGNQYPVPSRGPREDLVVVGSGQAVGRDMDRLVPGCYQTLSQFRR